MEIVIGLLIAFGLLYGAYLTSVWEDNRVKSMAPKIRNPRAQSFLKSRFKTEDVCGYTKDTWIVYQKTAMGTIHYITDDSGTILAKTNREGFIYAMYQCHKLFIVIGKNDPALPYHKQEKLYGAVDDQFNTTIPVIYDELDALEEDFIKATQQGLIGVYNPANRLIIPVKYNSVLQDKYSKRFIVGKQGTHHLYNYDGLLIKSLDFTSLYISHKQEKVRIKTFIADPEFDHHEDTDDQLKIGKWGLLDENYNELIPPQYALLYNGPNSVLVMNGKLKIDRSVDPWPGMQTYNFATGGHWGVCSFSNDIIIPISYDWIDFTSNKERFLVNSGGKMFYLKTWNRPPFWGITGGKWGLINEKNEVLVPLEYDLVTDKNNQILFQHSTKIVFDINQPYFTFDI